MQTRGIGLLKLLLPPHAQWTLQFMTGAVECMTGQCSFELQWKGERVHNQLPELGSMHWIHWARSHIPLPLLKHSTWTRQSVPSWGKILKQIASRGIIHCGYGCSSVGKLYRQHSIFKPNSVRALLKFISCQFAKLVLCITTTERESVIAS